MIEIPSKTLVDAATAGMPPEVHALLHDFHTEDHENVYVAIFTDDGGTTRIVWRELRQDAYRRFALGTARELKDGFGTARESSHSAVFWGIRA